MIKKRDFTLSHTWNMEWGGTELEDVDTSLDVKEYLPSICT